MPTFRALINSFDVDSLPATGAIISVLSLSAFPPRMRKSDFSRVWKAGNLPALTEGAQPQCSDSVAFRHQLPETPKAYGHRNSSVCVNVP